jgi:hypothetical protein
MRINLHRLLLLAVILFLFVCCMQIAYADDYPIAATQTYTVRCVALSVKAKASTKLTAEQAFGMAADAKLPKELKDASTFVSEMRRVWPKAEITVIAAGAMTLRASEATAAEFFCDKPRVDIERLRVKSTLIASTPTPGALVELQLLNTGGRTINAARIAVIADGKLAICRSIESIPPSRWEGTLIIVSVTPGNFWSEAPGTPVAMAK